MGNRVNDYIINHPEFSTEEFFLTLQCENPDIGRSTVYKILKNLCEQNRISRAGRGRYISSKKKNYDYPLSETAKTISSLIREQYQIDVACCTFNVNISCIIVSLRTNIAGRTVIGITGNHGIPGNTKIRIA